MILNFMKSNALGILEGDIPQNVKFYDNNEKWIDKYFSDKDISSYSFSTGITVPDVELIIGGPQDDFENSKRIYDALKDKLNPVQASDLRLWAYLAHDVYWDYMHNRWSINVAYDDDEEAENKLVSRIGTRYFFKASKGKAYVRQGIARLYWAAYLTYDENRENPYELTKFFLSKQDLFLASTERALARNKTILMAALTVLKENGSLKRKQIRNFFSALNQAGGVVMLDSLTAEDAHDLAERTLEEVLS